MKVASYKNDEPRQIPRPTRCHGAEKGRLHFESNSNATISLRQPLATDSREMMTLGLAVLHVSFAGHHPRSEGK